MLVISLNNPRNLHLIAGADPGGGGSLGGQDPPPPIFFIKREKMPHVCMNTPSFGT